MTDRIQHIIEEIRSKKNAVDNLLTIERQNLAKVKVENAQLSEKIEEELKNTQVLKDSNDRLNKDLELAKQEIQSLNERLKNSVSENNLVSIGKENVQIDELVREIEYCIGQLKNNA